MQDIGFDLISDMHLSPDDVFNWEDKATSLYCIVAGNVSYDLLTVFKTLSHLGTKYQAVFYVPGILEYETTDDIISRTHEIIDMVSKINNVCLLHQHVVTIDGVAILGINGWSNVSEETLSLTNLFSIAARHEDIKYLHNTLSSLQKHLDVRNIIVVSNAVPHPDLYFGEQPEISNNQIPLSDILIADTEHKVSHWAFGTYDKLVDTKLIGINFINNTYLNQIPFWPRRITISI